MTPEQKAWIDSATYRDMLSKVRFLPDGDPFFRKGTELGDYSWNRWKVLNSTTPQEERVAASKALGWD